MNSRYELHGELPSLDRPVLVVHLHGWIDASGAAAAMASARRRRESKGHRWISCRCWKVLWL